MTRRLLADESWRLDAACREIGSELFFPEHKGEHAFDAKRVCRGCVVREQCLNYALDRPDIEHGVWGGWSPRELRALRRARRRAAEAA